MLVDSHCHLDFPDYTGDVEGVVTRARAAGVGTCLSIGTELARFPGVLASVAGTCLRPPCSATPEVGRDS